MQRRLRYGKGKYVLYVIREKAVVHSQYGGFQILYESDDTITFISALARR